MKKFKTIILLTILTLFPSAIYAADIEITCYEDQKPLIVRNTDPLFKISSFLPGETEKREIYVVNMDPNNPCKIYLEGKGNKTKLGDNIYITIDGNILDTTLSDFLTSKKVLIADLLPTQEVTRNVQLYFDKSAGNSLKKQNMSFDILIESEWGKDGMGDSEGEVSGTTDTNKKVTFDQIATSISEALGIGGGEDTTNQDEEQKIEGTILGEKDDNGEVCTEKTLWWIPLVIQLILTIGIISIDKSVLEKKYMKMILSFVIASIAYFVINKIGCGCNPVWLCVNHWILNLVIGISPILRYFERKNTIPENPRDTLV